MILDADLTTIPEELPYFNDVIVSGQAEFVNGSRLVYPVPKGAMTGANMLGNKFFSVAFTYLLGQKVKDTLCGTKVLWRSDWERIKPMLGSWGTEDRWGDYELLFGAAKLNLKILDLPVHYQERIYGSTKMTKVFRNGHAKNVLARIPKAKTQILGRYHVPNLETADERTSVSSSHSAKIF